MKINKFFLYIGLLASIFTSLHSQNPENPYSLNSSLGKRFYWNAQWINHPQSSDYDYGIYHFRNTLDLDTIPEELIIFVSADNRYKLFINGMQVAFGPARGWKMNWRYETLDISPYLQEGKNNIAAEVVNFGIYRPLALESYHTGFIFQSYNPVYFSLNTGSGNWKVFQNPAYEPLPYIHKPGGLYAVGPGDILDGEKYPWGWNENNYDDSGWEKPHYLEEGHGRGTMWGNSWYLVPREIPMFESKQERFREVIEASSENSFLRFIEGKQIVIIPAHTETNILIDMGYLTTGFPELWTSRGEESKIELKYAEALYTYIPEGTGRAKYIKGNRNETDGKIFIGNSDVLYPDGGKERLFTPLFFRTFRFVNINIQTGGEPLELVDFYNNFSAYPLKKTAVFETGKPLLNEIIETGWRTQRLCAGETFYDCPYYEQMNYSGDSRVQALVCMAMSEDDRIIRDALKLFDQSRLANGLTQARAPSNDPLIINGYSLYYISMIYDYMMYRGNLEWLRQFLPGITSNLEWFERKLDQETGLLKALPWWNYTDWTFDWFGGIPPGADDGYTAITNMHFLYTLEQASKIFEALGESEKAAHWNGIASELKPRISEMFFDKDEDLFSDVPGKELFSQHANIFALLTDLVNPGQEKVLMEKILSDEKLTQCSYYYSYYLFKALKKSGKGNEFLDQLEPWKTMLENGLTTFAERPEPTRSDCHAWSASPLYFFMDIVCGIEPLEPGFKTVSISPNPGNLENFKASFPHPDGEIKIIYDKKNSSVRINLPISISGYFHYDGMKRELKPGLNLLSL